MRFICDWGGFRSGVCDVCGEGFFDFECGIEGRMGGGGVVVGEVWVGGLSIRDRWVKVVVGLVLFLFFKGSFWVFLGDRGFLRIV